MNSDPNVLNRRSPAGAADRLCAGDPAAREQLVRTHGGRLLATARRLLGDTAAAAAAVQDAFWSAFTAAEAPPDVGAWLLQQCIRSSVRRLPAASEVDARLLPAFDGEGRRRSAQSQWQGAGLASATALQQRIDQLPAQLRAVLVLRDVERLDEASTASLLHLDLDPLRQRLHEARMALRELAQGPLSAATASGG